MSAMKPHITQCDDGSVLIEWIRQGERFGMSLEPNLKGSGWYHVAIDGTNEEGELEMDKLIILMNFFAKETGC